MRKLISFLFLGLLCLTEIFAEQNLPKPPAGFHWQRLKSIRASVLSPDGWSYRAEESDGTLAHFITKDRFDGSGKFKTGYTLNCVRNLSKTAKMKPSEYIEAFTSEANAKYSIIDPETNTVGPTKMIWYGVQSPKEGPDATRMTYLLIANDTTDTFYLIIFEAPLAEWKKAYESGYVMLKNLSIDVTF
jgi:hypothetical protein